ncbi:MAG: hypothetical protein J6I36_11545 [Bacteroidaceae bacterium]|nr:hypothetical protein [Bacteroidaceae bacterium]
MEFLNTMTLSAQNKRWLGEHLLEEAAREENPTSVPHTRKVCQVRRRSSNAPSDAELDMHFAGTKVPEPPTDPEWHLVIDANTGKTIKPVEKWL